MKKNFRFYFKLFRTMFSLSAFTFGGGYVIVPLMRKQFVEKNHWIEDEEMLDIVAIAQSAPGVIAVNASILVGYRLVGVAGSVLTVFATVLPPLIIISIISVFYAAFQDNAAVAAVMKTMQAGVAAVIVDAVFKMGATVVKGKALTSSLVIAACFIASYFLRVNVAVIILTCGVIGAVNVLWREKKARNGGDGQ